MIINFKVLLAVFIAHYSLIYMYRPIIRDYYMHTCQDKWMRNLKVSFKVACMYVQL